jgi:hypothetical protein
MSTSQHIGDPGSPGQRPRDPADTGQPPRSSGAPAPTRYPIRYVPRREIDNTRWDACIDQSTTPLIYGCHLYLDHMAAGQWDALILGDYEAIMPLTWRRKYGVKYLYQPPFTQQTGIFSARPLPADLIAVFVQTAQKHFRFAEIFLNYGNSLPAFEPRTNYTLSLNVPYAQLAACYKKSLNESLRIARRSTLHYSSAIGLDEALQNNRRHYASRTRHVHAADYRHFEELCRHLQSRGQLLLRTVTGPDKRPLATVLLLRDHHRLYLVQSTTPAAGRKTCANHFLMDEFIREFAGQHLLLDFEGSELPGVAHFYKNFGSIDQPYYFYRYNRLPWFLKLIKH